MSQKRREAENCEEGGVGKRDEMEGGREGVTKEEEGKEAEDKEEGVKEGEGGRGVEAEKE